MAQRTTVTVVDDLDGSEGAATVKFGWLGQEYEIDLTQKNTDRFAKVIDPYLTAARQVGGRRTSARGDGSSRSKSDTAAIRKWAAEQGMTVSSRGRIPAEVVAKYQAAH